MSDALITVGDSSFKHTVLQAEKPVIVDLWATWCPPCRAIAPIFADLAEEYQGRVIFAKLDTDANPATPMEYGIQSIPTLLLFANGTLVDQIVGVRPRHELKRHIEQMLAAAAQA